MNLRPMHEAPRDGEILLSFWQDLPVLIAWIETIESERRGVWPFTWDHWQKTTGWRILALGRTGDYGIHGNYPPFDPPGFAFIRRPVAPPDGGPGLPLDEAA